MPRDEEPPIPCSLCERLFPRSGLTRHHARPKSKGGTNDDVELACPQCHDPLRAVHNLTRFGRFAAVECQRGHGHLQTHIVQRPQESCDVNKTG